MSNKNKKSLERGACAAYCQPLPSLPSLLGLPSPLLRCMHDCRSLARLVSFLLPHLQASLDSQLPISSTAERGMYCNVYTAWRAMQCMRQRCFL